MTLKDRIIDETLKLFSLKGFINTSINDILDAAGTTKGGFYNYFKSKEDLFFQVLAHARIIWRQRNLSGLEQLQDPFQQLEKLLQNYKDSYLKDSKNFPGGCVFITLSVELNDQNRMLFAEIDKGFVGLKRMIRRMLEKGKEVGTIAPHVDPETVTELVFTSMLGASVCFGADKSTAGLDKAIGALLAYLQTLKN